MRFSAYHILWCSESPLFALLFALLSFRIFSQSISGHESIVMCNGGNDLELLPNFIANLLWRMHLCAFVYARAIEETRWKIIRYLSMNKFGIEERESMKSTNHISLSSTMIIRLFHSQYLRLHIILYLLLGFRKHTLSRQHAYTVSAAASVGVFGSGGSFFPYFPLLLFFLLVFAIQFE